MSERSGDENGSAGAEDTPPELDAQAECDPAACGPNMPRRRNPSTALRYSAAAGDATLGELAEWDPKFAEPFAPGALISASGLSERRDFPSK